MGGYGGYGGFGFFGILFNVLFWVLIVVAVVSLVKWFVRGKSHDSYGEEDNADEAMRILKMRYAKGEITKREFESMKKDIM